MLSRPLLYDHLNRLAAEKGLPLAEEAGPSADVLRWKDPSTPLSIWQVGAPEDGVYRLCMGPHLAVDVLPDGQIISRPKPNLPEVTIDHFLADQVWPRLLARDGHFVVHAGAVRMGEMAIMLMGNSGRGKSTLVTSFDQAGFALLGDDAMVVSSLDTTPQVRAVYPSLRLFPDSIDALMPGAPTAGPVAHYSSKERVDVAIHRDADDRPVPIHIILCLAPASADGQIIVRRLTQAEACMALVESSFALDPSDVTQARRRLGDSSALARAVPAFEICYPRDYARLPEVRQAILDQVAALEPA